jgi:hypothetical protein
VAGLFYWGDGMKKTLKIDQAGLGSEWRGDSDGLDTLAEILRGMNTGWEIETCDDAWNGGSETVVDDDGFPVDNAGSFPESAWLAAIDRHAAEHPECWAT